MWQRSLARPTRRLSDKFCLIIHQSILKCLTRLWVTFTTFVRTCIKDNVKGYNYVIQTGSYLNERNLQIRFLCRSRVTYSPILVAMNSIIMITMVAA